MKGTKKSIFLSGLSLLFCLSLLVGTTFAWFTDTVSNKGNRIEAGTLKLDLLMDKGAGYESIAGGTGDIFSEATGNGILWEPGKTEIVYLGVKNDGSLALDYNIILDVVDGGLVGALEYAILDGVDSSAASNASSWADILALPGVQNGLVEDGAFVAAPNGKIVNADGIDYFAVAVHMNESAGNTYQDKNISIDVTVIAKQAQHETDDFGNNDYDRDAEWPSWEERAATPAELAAVTDDSAKTVKISSPSLMAALAKSVNNGNEYQGYTVTLERDIDLGDIPWTPIGISNDVSGFYVNGPFFRGSFDGQGNTISNLFIESTDGKNNLGFFGGVDMAAEGSAIENIVFENATVIGEKSFSVGVLAGSARGRSAWVTGQGNIPDAIKNITVNNATVRGAKYVGGVIGYATLSMENIEANNVNVTSVTNLDYKSDSGENAGGIAGNLYDLFRIDNARVSNSVISGRAKISGIVGSAHNSYGVKNSSVNNVDIAITDNGSGTLFGWITGRAAAINLGNYKDNTVTGGSVTRNGVPFTIELVKTV